MRPGALFRDCRGAAAAEMAMVLPLLLALMFGVTELGRYFWSEHVLLKGVWQCNRRDGGRVRASDLGAVQVVTWF